MRRNILLTIALFWCTNGTMKYDAEVKARIPKAWLKTLETTAQQEDLKVSDIIRRAIRGVLGRKAAITRTK